MIISSMAPESDLSIIVSSTRMRKKHILFHEQKLIKLRLFEPALKKTLYYFVEETLWSQLQSIYDFKDLKNQVIFVPM